MLRAAAARAIGIVAAAMRRAALLLLLLAATLASAGGAPGAANVKVFFARGEQLAAVQRPGSTVDDALAALPPGPSAAEKAKGARSYVPAGTVVRSVTVDGDVATVDLGEE